MPPSFFICKIIHLHRAFTKNIPTFVISVNLCKDCHPDERKDLKNASIVIPNRREGSQKRGQEIFSGKALNNTSHTRFEMTKQCFVIGEFISVTMNEPMLFSFVIDEFCSNRSNVA